MTDKELDKLLDRFASDEINESEQQQLIEQLESAENPTPLPDGLEHRLAATIDTLDASERTRKSISLRPRRKFPLRVIAGLAASVAVTVALGVHMFTTRPSTAPTPLDTCATPEEAYAETQRALLIFSNALNKGMEQLETARATTTEINDRAFSKV